MSVRIRLKKLGRRHRPYYRICVMDARAPRDGKAIEEVGTYDPLIPEKDKRCSMKAARIDYWLSVGAQPTEKVKALINLYKGKVPEKREDKRRPRPVPEAPVLPPRQRAPEPTPGPEAPAAEPVETAAEAS